MDPRFTFRLERVRDMREQAEDLAKEELAHGLRHRREGEEALAVASAAVGRAHSLHPARGAAAAFAATDLIAAQAFVERTLGAQRDAALELSRRDAEVDARRVVLARAAQDREVIERLKRDKYDAFRVATARREAGELDEIALTMVRRRAA